MGPRVLHLSTSPGPRLEAHATAFGFSACILGNQTPPHACVASTFPGCLSPLPGLFLDTHQTRVELTHHNDLGFYLITSVSLIQSHSGVLGVELEHVNL